MHFNFLADDMSSNIANRHVDCLSNRFDFELLLTSWQAFLKRFFNDFSRRNCGLPKLAWILNFSDCPKQSLLIDSNEYITSTCYVKTSRGK